MHYQHIESIAPTPTACADQEEDVDIGTNNEPYEQSVAAEDMEIDEKPQVSIFPNQKKKFWCQSNEKPSIAPSCPGVKRYRCCFGLPHCSVFPFFCLPACGHCGCILKRH